MERVSHRIQGWNGVASVTWINYAGWWFGTFFPLVIFPYILGIIIPIGYYFSEGFKPPTSMSLEIFGILWRCLEVGMGEAAKSPIRGNP